MVIYWDKLGLLIYNMGKASRVRCQFQALASRGMALYIISGISDILSPLIRAQEHDEYQTL